MTESASSPIEVDIRALTRKFADRIVVDQASFAVRRSEIFGLIGPNGAGKSTLLKMLTTLLPPTSGTAIVAGCDLVRQPQAVRRRIGYVPQLLSADAALTGRENVLLSARLYGIPRAERKPRTHEALETMGLTEHADRLVGHYSGGMIRRLEIAQSLIHRPRVLFLDEPTVGLDPSARQAVWSHVLDLRKSFGTAMIVTSHQMEEIEELCDRIALITLGRIVAVGTSEELKASVGPGATLDDVFIKLAGSAMTIEDKRGFHEARSARRAEREHG
ncbi:MAG: ATP-binding cassette domain-containing protein [Alphaproteobacteria bacterium]